MFFHVLSWSFNFFVFVGCSKSDFFWGLNFVTICLDSSIVKNQFLGPSRGVAHLWAPFSFFSYCFFFHFFVFFLASYFFIFSHFLFISSFFDFLMFFIFFFHFFRRKSFFFSFFNISFKNCLLLALVSELNCFLRSRCSMEMRFPDDIGLGIAGIGLGRLLGREHASTPQSGVEAPRLLKRSLPRLYYCCSRHFYIVCVCPQHVCACRASR